MHDHLSQSIVSQRVLTFGCRKSDEYIGQYDLSGGSLLEEEIVSTSDTQFARLMKRFGNTDWVKEGQKKYLKKVDGVCPFCHKELDHQHFEEELKECFDEEYQESIKNLATYKAEYDGWMDAVLDVLDKNSSTNFPRADLSLYSEKLKRLRTIIQNNQKIIQQKVDKPAEKVELQDTDTLVAELDDIVSEINKLIIANNEAYDKKKETKANCDKLRDLYRELHPEDYRDVPPFEDSYERYCKENGINLKSEGMIMTEHDKKYYRSLIDELRKLPKETEWAEFKVNNFAPNEIGEYLSTLSNSGALHEKETAYLLYGVHDETHEIVGTKFKPKEAKVGNEELENWLLTQLTPRIDFKFVEVYTEKGPVVVVEIPVAKIQPTAFKGVEYIRVGSYSKKLKDFPEKERKLWRMFEIRPFETMSAKENVDSETITRMLDTGAFYTLMSLPVPSTRDGIIHDFSEYGFIKRMDNGNYSITNMGALLFAKDIRDFIYLENKRIRVIRYKGSGRTNAIRDQFFYKGYAVGFDDIVNYIMSMLPQEETIETARREEFIMFPEKAVREMLGNLMIHQDMTARGQSLMVEIFDERIEATNPGSLLVDVDRIIDTAPHARNEKMADFLRLVHICEVRGSGFDRMEEGMCDWKIPAPKVETGEDFCRTMFFWHESLSKWSKEDKTRTCYLYVCYCYVNGIEVSNAVLRDRFGITEANKAMASRIIKDTVETGKIKLKDPNAAVKMRRYVPYWA